MTRTSKGESSCWYGYLVAGERSSPVLRDSRLDTGNKKTIYMFNLNRSAIIQYAYEIVEKKLRDLESDESKYIAKLNVGYKKARRSFKGRVSRKSNAAIAAIRPTQRARDDNDDDDINLEDSDRCLEFD